MRTVILRRNRFLGIFVKTLLFLIILSCSEKTELSNERINKQRKVPDYTASDEEKRDLKKAIDLINKVKKEVEKTEGYKKNQRDKTNFEKIKESEIKDLLSDKEIREKFKRANLEENKKIKLKTRVIKFIPFSFHADESDGSSFTLSSAILQILSPSELRGVELRVFHNKTLEEDTKRKWAQINRKLTFIINTNLIKQEMKDRFSDDEKGKLGFRIMVNDLEELKLVKGESDR